MKNNFAPILMMAMYVVMVMNYKKIYFNITKDNTFCYIKKFKRLIYLSALLNVFSCLLLLYSINVSNNSIVNEIGFDTFVLSMLLTIYSLYYITNNRDFPNIDKQIVRAIKLSMKSIFVIVLLQIIVSLIMLYR